MNEKILARAEFSKTHAFLTGLIKGFLFAIPCWLLYWFLYYNILFFRLPPVFTLFNESIPVIVPLGVAFWNTSRKRELVITDTKITAVTGNQVHECPLESITSCVFRHGHLHVEAPPRKFTVESIKNHEDISMILNYLFNQSQNTPVFHVHAASVSKDRSNAEELKKYKELLDMGAITQEEYDSKKQQLLKQ